MSSGEEGLDEDDFGFRGRAETPDDSVEGDGAKTKRKDKKRRKRTPAEKEARRLRKEAEAAARNPGGASPSGSVPSDDSAMSSGIFGSRKSNRVAPAPSGKKGKGEGEATKAARGNEATKTNEPGGLIMGANVKKCPTCRFPVIIGARFCAGCGTRNEDQSAVEHLLRDIDGEASVKAMIAAAKENGLAAPDFREGVTLTTAPPPPAMDGADPVVVHVWDPDWARCGRLCHPCGWDCDKDMWPEPRDPEAPGETLAPFRERFLYYLCDRHQVLVCVFHDQDDDFSAVERQVSIVCTVMQCWWCTLMMVSGLEEAEAATEEARVSVLPDFVVVAIVTDIFTTIFEAFSKFEYRNIEIGRVITVPLFLAHLLMAAITTSGNAHREELLAKTSWMFIVALACEWLAIQPLYVATRVFLYGVGCRCRGVPIGLGPKSPF